MKKKKSGGGGANWMDTYGDMVTLLLCFFVLLYSMSTISEEKWRAIVTSFNPFAQEDPTDPVGNNGPVADPADESQGGYPAEPDVAAQRDIEETMEELLLAIQTAVSEEGWQSVVQVSMEGGDVYISFRDSVFFNADKYDLLPEGQAILGSLCPLLNEAEDAIDEIRIQGHTAQGSPNRRNDPWNDMQLAANRAIAVTLFLRDNSNIHPTRIIPESYGQWRPISSNKTAEGRAPNRRVEMVISGRDLSAEAFNEAMSNYMTTIDGDAPGQSAAP